MISLSIHNSWIDNDFSYYIYPIMAAKKSIYIYILGKYNRFYGTEVLPLVKFMEFVHIKDVHLGFFVSNKLVTY